MPVPLSLLLQQQPGSSSSSSSASGFGDSGALMPSPLINGISVARALQGLPSPLFSAREWKSGSTMGQEGVWGRWAGWSFEEIAEVADRVVKSFGAPS